MSFMLEKHLVFLDTYQFMSLSLDKLVSNIPKEAFKYTSKEFENNEEFKLMIKKGIYPYDYMDSSNRFNKKNLPMKEDFYSVFNKEYEHAKNVWNAFNIKTMGEYNDLYLKSDILL